MEKRDHNIYLAQKTLVAGSMNTNKLKRHLETFHSEFVGKHTWIFHRQQNQFYKQKQTLSRIVTGTLLHQNQCLYHSKLHAESPKAKEPNSTAESSLSPAATDIIEIKLTGSYAKEIRKIPLAYNTTGGKYMSGISGYFVINSFISFTSHVLLCQ